jgi:hypothetical protein
MPVGLGPASFIGNMTTRVTSFTTLPVSRMLVDRDNFRYAICFALSAGGAGDYVLCPTGNLGGNIGFTLTGAGATLMLPYNEYGDLVQESWWINQFTAGPTLTVIEGIWLPGV